MKTWSLSLFSLFSCQTAFQENIGLNWGGFFSVQINIIFSVLNFCKLLKKICCCGTFSKANRSDWQYERSLPERGSWLMQEPRRSQRALTVQQKPVACWDAVRGSGRFPWWEDAAVASTSCVSFSGRWASVMWHFFLSVSKQRCR